MFKVKSQLVHSHVKSLTRHFMADEDLEGKQQQQQQHSWMKWQDRNQKGRIPGSRRIVQSYILTNMLQALTNRIWIALGSQQGAPLLLRPQYPSANWHCEHAVFSVKVFTRNQEIFIHWFIHSPTHSFIHSFIHLLIHRIESRSNHEEAVHSCNQRGRVTGNSEDKTPW